VCQLSSLEDQDSTAQIHAECRAGLVNLLKQQLLPLDYGRWQGDELFDEIISIIENKNG
jgi:hypothetical protein